MESNSSSRKILCSDTAAKLLKEQAPDIPVIKRGKIGVKGKGEMCTYWVAPPPSNVDKDDAKDVGVQFAT